MLRLTDDVLHWLLKRIPDPPVKPKGGRPPLDKAKARARHLLDTRQRRQVEGLAARVRRQEPVHRYFQRWVRDGIFERILRQAGRVAEERDGFKLYECFIDGTFAKAAAAVTAWG
ncbi:MAG: hypothetical protein U1D55_02965 [Phycisphaerae bacterium]